MIREYEVFFEAFQHGKEIKNAVKAKNIQLLSTGIAGLLGTLLVISQAFGYHVPVDQSVINSAASGLGSIYLIIQAVCTVISSSKVGFKKKEK